LSAMSIRSTGSPVRTRMVMWMCMRLRVEGQGG